MAAGTSEARLLLGAGPRPAGARRAGGRRGARGVVAVTAAAPSGERGGGGDSRETGDQPRGLKAHARPLLGRICGGEDTPPRAERSLTLFGPSLSRDRRDELNGFLARQDEHRRAGRVDRILREGG